MSTGRDAYDAELRRIADQQDVEVQAAAQRRAEHAAALVVVRRIEEEVIRGVFHKVMRTPQVQALAERRHVEDRWFRQRCWPAGALIWMNGEWSYGDTFYTSGADSSTRLDIGRNAAGVYSDGTTHPNDETLTVLRQNVVRYMVQHDIPYPAERS